MCVYHSGYVVMYNTRGTRHRNGMQLINSGCTYIISLRFDVCALYTVLLTYTHIGKVYYPYTGGFTSLVQCHVYAYTWQVPFPQRYKLECQCYTFPRTVTIIYGIRYFKNMKKLVQYQRNYKHVTCSWLTPTRPHGGGSILTRAQ